MILNCTPIHDDHSVCRFPFRSDVEFFTNVHLVGHESFVFLFDPFSNSIVSARTRLTSDYHPSTLYMHVCSEQRFTDEKKINTYNNITENYTDTSQPTIDVTHTCERKNSYSVAHEKCTEPFHFMFFSSSSSELCLLLAPTNTTEIST